MHKGRLATKNLTNVEWNRVAEWWAGRFEGGHESLPKFYDDRNFDEFHSILTKNPLHKDRQLEVIYDPVLSLTRIRKELESKSDEELAKIICDNLKGQMKENSEFKKTFMKTFKELFI